MTRLQAFQERVRSVYSRELDLPDLGAEPVDNIRIGVDEKDVQLMADWFNLYLNIPLEKVKFEGHGSGIEPVDLHSETQGVILETKTFHFTKETIETTSGGVFIPTQKIFMLELATDMTPRTVKRRKIQRPTDCYIYGIFTCVTKPNHIDPPDDIWGISIDALHKAIYMDKRINKGTVVPGNMRGEYGWYVNFQHMTYMGSRTHGPSGSPNTLTGTPKRCTTAEAITEALFKKIINL